ncbi:hypothetical protein C8R43DRAFT_1195906 [Mycena crocata]|nr:hypothetical protein C8R43DRAFT_1195906 [Mycena crocata]
MSSLNPDSQSTVFEAVHIPASSSNSEFEWAPAMNETAPPAYTYEEPPPYQRSSWGQTGYSGISLQESFRLDEANRRQELQLLLGVLFAIFSTLILMDALPMLGAPTSSIHVLRVYGWFTSSLLLGILLATISSICKYWLTGNHPNNLPFINRPHSRSAPESRIQGLKTHVMNSLIGCGSVLLSMMTICFGVGLLDFFWQVYPVLVVGSVTACGLYGGGPGLSSLSQGPLSKTHLASLFRNPWQFARMWNPRSDRRRELVQTEETVEL